MNEIQKISFSPEETFQVGREFAKTLKGGELIGLCGELGAGKTCFAKGVISYFTSLPQDELPSPSFTLVEEYLGSPSVYHVDLYRLDPDQAECDIPWEDLLESGGVILVEWPDRYPYMFLHCHCLVNLSRGKNPATREISIRISADFMAAGN